jgi:hypothetical protein
MRIARRLVDVANELAAIPKLSRATLVERWVAAYGRPPPRGLSRRLLEYAAAWRVQSQAFGGLDPALRRRLHRSAAPGAEKTSQVSRVARPNGPPPGSRLVREWHGRTYTVDVVETGFLLDGRSYGSLSQVARAITGARWSGPRFFGL